MNEIHLKTIILSALQEIAPEVDLDAVDPGADLRRELDIDSFDFLNVIIALNEALGIEIPESDYGKLNTLSGLLGYLADRFN